MHPLHTHRGLDRSDAVISVSRQTWSALRTALAELLGGDDGDDYVQSGGGSVRPWPSSTPKRR